MKEKKKILIVGAGLAGLAMYIALDKKKFYVKIVEKREQFKRLGYALIFMPLGVRALKKLGFTSSQIDSLGASVLENRVRNKDGTLKQVTDFRPIITKLGRYMIVTRERLYNLLEEKVPVSDIHFGRSIKSLSQSSTGKVHTGFDKGEIKKDYDMVIGADGIHSSVRELLFPHVKPNPLGLSLIWAWIPRKEGIYPKHGGFGDVKAGVGFFNSGEPKKSCMAFFLETKILPKNISPKDYQRLLRKHLNGFKGPVPKILKHLPPGNQLFLHEDYELNLKKWYRGHAVLIGDAAHARSVFSGAGSALALEDALVLGYYLNQEHSIKAAVKNYYNRQRGRAEKVAMSKISLYLQDRKGVAKYLKDFIASSFLYEEK